MQRVIVYPQARGLGVPLLGLLRSRAVVEAVVTPGVLFLLLQKERPKHQQ